ncbi:MAG: VOC family protein [Lachnospiraceae bacterium]
MKLKHIHHIAIIVSDYEKAKDFYVRKLGFKVIRENYREDRADYKLDLKMGRQELEIFAVKNAPARLSYPEACGLRHLAFEVEDLDQTVRELNEKGIDTEPVRFDTFTQVRMTFFKDPDGLPIEIREIEE